jgi:ubiquinone/menaquinone biosynthesis C-methylase UbiE
MRAITVTLPASARRVLDLGCGTGWMLAESGSEDIPLRVGLDYSVDSLREARKYPGICWIAGDGLNLPFRERSFDVVIGHVSTPYMDTNRTMSEIYRVLEPGGSFFLTFHSFRYWRERLAGSVRACNVKDILFMGYVAINGLLNHFGFQQHRFWLRRKRFETVNTATGVARSARSQGFDQIATESKVDRIFFVMTGRKPNGGDKVMPAPHWSAHSRLHHA